MLYTILAIMLHLHDVLVQPSSIIAKYYITDTQEMTQRMYVTTSG